MDYWKRIFIQYCDLISLSKSKASSISQNVGLKNKYREDLTTLLNSIIHMIMANHPQTYKSELRAWGFQKESY